jgi:hypothetical protein
MNTQLDPESVRKVLSLADIKAAHDVPEEYVEVPEWGGAVLVRGVSVADGMRLLEQMKGEGDEVDPEKAMLVACVVGVAEPKFAESDVDWLKTKSLSAVKRVTDAFMRLSGLQDAALKEARKN